MIPGKTVHDETGTRYRVIDNRDYKYSYTFVGRFGTAHEHSMVATHSYHADETDKYYQQYERGTSSPVKSNKG